MATEGINYARCAAKTRCGDDCPSVYLRVEVDLYGPHGAGYELDRLIKGPGPVTVGKFEAALMAGYTTSEARTHVITGRLKASGHPSSAFDGPSWQGTIGFARYPGIYELARGNKPSKHHPAGGHYLLGPGGQDFERAVREATWDFITDGEGGPAPSEGLTWKSGGDDS